MTPLRQMPYNTALTAAFNHKSLAFNYLLTRSVDALLSPWNSPALKHLAFFAKHGSLKT